MDLCERVSVMASCGGCGGALVGVLAKAALAKCNHHLCNCYLNGDRFGGMVRAQVPAWASSWNVWNCVCRFDYEGIFGGNHSDMYLC